MSTPPEVLFHRFFQRKELSSTDRHNYKGKQDLDVLDPTVGSLLASVQVALNEALRNEKKNVPEHVGHPPFHFDYVDSSVPNAVAFRYEGYSFIGITMSLVNLLWEACLRLSRSQEVATILVAPITPEKYDSIQVLLFPTQLNFVVSHEYTHHVHGHTLLTGSGSDSMFSSEVPDAHEIGNMEQQAWEVDADGYAVYHVLADLIDGGRRSQAVGLLQCEAEQASVQDEVLFSSFVIAVGGFLLLRPPVAIDEVTVYKLTHPPQAARMNSIMQSAIAWCKQNRPALVPWMTRDRFQALMSAAAKATWGLNGGNDWHAQTAFLQSEEGATYISRLDECVKAHVKSL